MLYMRSLRPNEIHLIVKLASLLFLICRSYLQFLALPLAILLISINLLVVYRESVNLIGYITRRLSADSLQL